MMQNDPKLKVEILDWVVGSDGVGKWVRMIVIAGGLAVLDTVTPFGIGKAVLNWLDPDA